VLRSNSPVSAEAEKKAAAQMKFNSKGGWGRRVKEVLEGSLHALDACLALLLSYSAGEGNMGKPALVVHEGGMQE